MLLGIIILQSIKLIFSLSNILLFLVILFSLIKFYIFQNNFILKIVKLVELICLAPFHQKLVS